MKQHNWRMSHVFVKTLLESLLMDFVNVFVVVTQHQLPQANEDVHRHEQDETLSHPVDVAKGGVVEVCQTTDDWP